MACTNRCRDCSLITVDSFHSFPGDPPLFVKTFAELDESAGLGCDMCVLIRCGMLMDAPTKWALAQQNLDMASTRFRVSCRRFANDSAHGHINVEPVESAGSVRMFSMFWACFKLEVVGGELDCLDCLKTWRKPGQPAIKSFAPERKLMDLRELAQETMLPWMEKCDRQHELCAKPSNSTSALVPTRLIDVGSTVQNPFLVVTASNSDKEPFEYVALSYTWGSGNEAAKTTASNLEERKRGIHLEDLPQSIQDAVHVTRALGRRYLWVDALCIVQDGGGGDKTDWANEAPRMCDYYHNAVVTIAAASASDSADGFLTEREAGRYPLRPCWVAHSASSSIEARDGMHQPLGLVKPPSSESRGDSFWTSGVEYAPLRDRGWAFQERALSRRSLHFTEKGVQWECAGMHASEGVSVSREWRSDFLMPLGAVFRELGQQQQRRRRRRRRGGGLEVTRLREIWAAVVERYSKLRLAVESDRLLALAGLTRRFEECLPGNEALFGLWTSDVVLSLGWREARAAERGPPAKSCRAPSWSWASSAGPVLWLETWFTMEDQPRPVARFVEYSGQKDPFLFGEADKCALRIKCSPQQPPADHGLVQRDKYGGSVPQGETVECDCGEEECRGASEAEPVVESRRCEENDSAAAAAAPALYVPLLCTRKFYHAHDRVSGGGPGIHECWSALFLVVRETAVAGEFTRLGVDHWPVCVDHRPGCWLGNWKGPWRHFQRNRQIISLV